MFQKNNSDEIKELEELYQRRQIVDNFIKKIREQTEKNKIPPLYIALFVILVAKLEFLLKDLLAWLDLYYCQKCDYQEYEDKTLGEVIKLYQKPAFQTQIKNLKDKVQPGLYAKLFEMFLNKSNNSKSLFVEDCLKINNLRNNLYHSNLLAGENNHKNNKNLQQIIKEIKQYVSPFKESYFKKELEKKLITSNDINDISNDIQSGLLDYLIQIIKEIETIILRERKH